MNKTVQENTPTKHNAKKQTTQNTAKLVQSHLTTLSHKTRWA